MVELSTIYNNTHKFLKERMAADFKAYEQKHGMSAFDYVQALVFATLSETEPKKNQVSFRQLVEVYGNDPDFKALIDKTLNHVKEQYKGETLKFASGKKVNLEQYVEYAQKQLNEGKVNFEERLGNLTKKSDMEL